MPRLRRSPDSAETAPLETHTYLTKYAPQSGGNLSPVLTEIAPQFADSIQLFFLQFLSVVYVFSRVRTPYFSVKKIFVKSQVINVVSLQSI